MGAREPEQTHVERVSGVELVVRRTIRAQARIVYEAWTKPALFRQWWVPESIGIELLSCEMDVRVGGQYRLVFAFGDTTMEFFGTYVEVVPDNLLVWTNEEVGGETRTTVRFEETDGKTLVTVLNRYPSEEALESDGSTAALPESLAQLEELVVRREG